MIIKKLPKQHIGRYVVFKNRVAKESEYIKETTYSKAEAMFNTENIQIYVIYDIDDLDIIGTLIIKPFEEDNDLLYISLLAVLSKYYGKGIASLLMDKVIEVAKKNKKSILELIVSEDNHRARTFYEKYGFSYYKDYREGKLIYRLEL